MRTNLLGTLLFFITYSITAQTRLNLGFTAGPTIAWASSETKLQNNFFKASKAGYNGGLSLSLQAGEHFFSKISTIYSTQIFVLRQTSNLNYKIDTRFRFHELEIPIIVGFTGYLGSLKHREFIGAALSLNLNTSQKIIVGDSLLGNDININTTSLNKVFPLLMAGFEIGSQFKNDAALFFGITLRYGVNAAYSGILNSTRYGIQNTAYKGTYVGLEVTYFLPRFSYWFKREFVY
jgi:hypothetical protein